MWFWMLFWKFLLIAVLSLFSVMAVIVTIGGAKDVASLFSRLRDHESSDVEN